VAGRPGAAGAGKVLGYSRNVYEIAFKAQADIGELLEQSLLESGQKYGTG